MNYSITIKFVLVLVSSVIDSDKCDVYYYSMCYLFNQV